jgi:hypothetical protein
MGIAILAYVILDGYDLGIGMLMADADRTERDRMIATIGPFWDANETWLVLGIGLLLVAFPMAHGMVLSALYLPVALMLLGLTMRGVAFEFRVKAPVPHQAWWDRTFVAGSTLAALMQGYMLGKYVMGFGDGWQSEAFAVLSAGRTGRRLHVRRRDMARRQDRRRAAGPGRRLGQDHLGADHGGNDRHLGRDAARFGPASSSAGFPSPT